MLLIIPWRLYFLWWMVRFDWLKMEKFQQVFLVWTNAALFMKNQLYGILMLCFVNLNQFSDWRYLFWLSRYLHFKTVKIPLMQIWEVQYGGKMQFRVHFWHFLTNDKELEADFWRFTYGLATSNLLQCSFLCKKFHFTWSFFQEMFLFKMSEICCNG